MALKIISADERLSEALNKDTFAIFGEYGVGKTSLLYTLPEDSTLFIDLEAGMKSVQTWRGDTISIRTFNDALDLACLIGGPNLGVRPEDPFSQAHYDAVRGAYATLDLARYRTVFFDSVTDLTHVAMSFAKAQPSAKSEKTGKDDIRGAYGELGRQVIGLLKQLQHSPGRNTVFVGRLKRTVNDFGAEIYEPEMVGGMTGRELPGIVDHVFTMSLFDFDEATGGWSHNLKGGRHRAFVTQRINPWNLPAKTRSEHLDIIEVPNLGKLLDKINQPSKITAADRTFEVAPPPATAENPVTKAAKRKEKA
jgi:hypothetical protein